MAAGPAGNTFLLLGRRAEGTARAGPGLGQRAKEGPKCKKTRVQRIKLNKWKE